MAAPAVSTISRDELALLRRECGIWLKEKREAVGLSQRGVSDRIGVEFYTFISQIEQGRGRVPPERFEAYAKALQMDPKDFTKTMLRYSEPLVYGLLFPEEPRVRADMSKLNKSASVEDLEKRIAMLEKMLMEKNQ